MVAGPEERLRFVFAANRPGWSDLVQTGDLIVGGRNFGTGSGRPAARLLVELGIRGLVAESINGLFMRNAVNHGLPALEVPGVTSIANEGDEIEVDFATGRVRTIDSGIELKGHALPAKLLEIAKAGGVLAILARDGYIADTASPGSVGAQA